MRIHRVCFLFFLVCIVQSMQGSSSKSSFHTNEDSLTHRKRHFYLQNTIKEKRTVPLPRRSVNILVKELKRDTGELSRFNSIECLFDSLMRDSLKVRLFSEETDIEYLNYFTNISTSYYDGNYDRAFRKAALKNIQYINMKTPFRHTMSRVGGVIMSLSIITIVSTPLAGIRLNTEARAAARSQVFLTGLTGFVVAVPFFVLGRNKKYGLSPEYETSKRNYWILRQKFE